MSAISASTNYDYDDEEEEEEEEVEVIKKKIVKSAPQPVSFQWIIPNFCNLLHSHVQGTYTPSKLSSWMITIFPKGDGKNNEGYVSVWIYQDTRKQSSKATVKLSLLNEKQEKFHQIVICEQLFTKYIGQRISRYVSTKEAKDVRSDGKLELHFEISYH